VTTERTNRNATIARKIEQEILTALVSTASA
jgi:hypothetical protein